MYKLQDGQISDLVHPHTVCWHFGSQNDNSNAWKWKISVSETHSILLWWTFVGIEKYPSLFTFPHLGRATNHTCLGNMIQLSNAKSIMASFPHFWRPIRRVAQKLIDLGDMSRVRGTVIWNILTVALYNDHLCQWMAIPFLPHWPLFATVYLVDHGSLK